MLTGILIGTALGILSGLGTGGGSLLILYLTLIEGIDHPSARAINLMFFIPSAIVACCFRWKQGKLEWKTLIPGIIGGCLSAALFSFLSTRWNAELLQKLFGILLLFTGLRELFYRNKKTQGQ